MKFMEAMVMIQSKFLPKALAKMVTTIYTEMQETTTSLLDKETMTCMVAMVTILCSATTETMNYGEEPETTF